MRFLTRQSIAIILLLLFVGLGMHSLTNLPVPVLAETEQRFESAKDDLNISGVAREKHTRTLSRLGDSRGGQSSFPIVEIHTEKGIVSR